MIVHVKGRLDATICRLAAVGSEDEIKRLFTAMLVNAVSHGMPAVRIPDTAEGQCEALCRLWAENAQGMLVDNLPGAERPSVENPHTIRTEWLWNRNTPRA